MGTPCKGAFHLSRGGIAAGMAMAIASTLYGCSSQELYATGQGWQRQECNKIIDSQERSRCMASASRSYEEYKREAEGGKSK